MTDLRPQVRVDAEEWATARAQLNAILATLQQGGQLLAGLRLDVSRTAAPSAAPNRGEPNAVLVNVSGTIKLYLWDGSAWVVVGTQT